MSLLNSEKKGKLTERKLLFFRFEKQLKVKTKIFTICRPAQYFLRIHC